MTDPNALDCSKWGGELTSTEAACMKDAGVRLLIVGTGNPHPGGAGEWARQQAQAWLDAGGEILDAYIYLYFAGDPKAQVQQALVTLDGLPVRRWWLDAEDTESPLLTPGQRGTFLDIALQELDRRSLDAGIYSGRWWWIPNMGNSSEFSELPLWNSYYDGVPDEDGLPYGGWEHSAIEQYAGTTTLCGQSVDLNYAKDLEEESMTDLEDVQLAMFAGSEQPGDRATRLSYAQGRIAQIASGIDEPGFPGSAHSLVEIAAATNAGELPDHEHEPGGVKR